jgi:N-acetylglucosaminyldiphosphoundecaprenol N-acetyl-beta-D-mannosaminyltransferase
LIASVGGFSYERRCFDFSQRIGDAGDFFEKARKHGWRVMSVGGSRDEAAQFEDVIKKRYCGAVIIHAISGFDRNLLEKVSAEIDRNRTTHVILGLGAPLQESIALGICKRFPSIDVFTCGGFITQTALKKGDFYPIIIQKLGLRWFYRFVKQKGLLKRTIVEYPRGICYFVLQNYRFKK